MNIHLHPPRQPMPANAWHSLLNAGLVFFFLLTTWIHGLDFMRGEQTLTPAESTLLLASPSRALSHRGDPHPLFVALELWSQRADLPPLLFNRLLSVAALAGSLWAMGAMLGRHIPWLLAASACLLFLTLPGFALFGISAGGGILSLFFYLLALSASSHDGAKGRLVFAGVCAALACGLHAVWLLPSIGIALGLWETHKGTPRIFLVGFFVALPVFIAVTALTDRAWLAHNPFSGLSVPGATPADFPGIGTLFTRHLVLMACLPLLLWAGRDRRGVGWWTLLLAVPPALVPSFFADSAHAVLPLFPLLMLGLPRLPMLLGIRFPATYQSVLGLQFLLWLPLYFGGIPWSPFPDPRQIADPHAWNQVKQTIRDAPGTILSPADIASRLQSTTWVYRVRDLDVNPAQRLRVADALAHRKIAYVLLADSAPPLPEDLAALVREHYLPLHRHAPFVLWVPAEKHFPTNPTP